MAGKWMIPDVWIHNDCSTWPMIGPICPKCKSVRVCVCVCECHSVPRTVHTSGILANREQHMSSGTHHFMKHKLLARPMIMLTQEIQYRLILYQTSCLNSAKLSKIIKHHQTSANTIKHYEISNTISKKSNNPSIQQEKTPHALLRVRCLASPRVRQVQRPSWQPKSHCSGSSADQLGDVLVNGKKSWGLF